MKKRKSNWLNNNCVVGSCLISLVLLIFPFVGSLSCEFNKPTLTSIVPQSVPVYTYKIVNTFPHDPKAYTQGLEYDNDILYESTGLYGSSSLRKVDIETGKVLKVYNLPAACFGEGITIWKDTIVQLTWKNNKGFVYAKNSFALQRDFSYTTEGWGLTHDGSCLIMSDGSSLLYFLDPTNFQITGHIQVHDNNGPVSGLNELEHIRGHIYANIWGTDRIAIIDPGNGQVSGRIDLAGLLEAKYRTNPVDILNGIAYDAVRNRLFVTGKLWPVLFEIEAISLPAKRP